MGLLVKYRSDRVAYIVTPVGYQRVVNETGSWRLDEKALQPGRYRVEVRFRAIGGRRGSLSFAVTNEGKDGGIRCDLIDGNLAG